MNRCPDTPPGLSPDKLSQGGCDETGRGGQACRPRLSAPPHGQQPRANSSQHYSRYKARHRPHAAKNAHDRDAGAVPSPPAARSSQQRVERHDPVNGQVRAHDQSRRADEDLPISALAHEQHVQHRQHDPHNDIRQLAHGPIPVATKHGRLPRSTAILQPGIACTIRPARRSLTAGRSPFTERSSW